MPLSDPLPGQIILAAFFVLELSEYSVSSVRDEIQRGLEDRHQVT